MKIILLILVLLLAAIFAKSYFFGFRAQRPLDYSDLGPALSLREHLSGDLISEGVIYGPNGRVRTSFVAEMKGEWEGNKGTLSEIFSYSNGSTQERKWTLTLGQENQFTATAPDIVGEAQGTLSGATAMITYRIILPEGAGGHQLDVIDWMYLMENGTIINRSQMYKFGIKVAELVATIRKEP